jgi:hypothetical protein
VRDGIAAALQLPKQIWQRTGCYLLNIMKDYYAFACRVISGSQQVTGIAFSQIEFGNVLAGVTSHWRRA